MEMIGEVFAKWQQRWSGLGKLQFSNWVLWKCRNRVSNVDRIGVYILAKFETNEELPRRVDPLDQHIVYIGQTNIGRTTTLKRRLSYFDKEAFGNGAAHSGASTYKTHYGTVQDDLYVSVCPILWLDDEINKLTRNKDNFDAWIGPSSPQPEPFIIYLITNWLEVCLRGLYVYKWGRLPICNKE
ncbi:hypothetical protein ES703_20045 [subsurface metagenome]